MARQNPPFSHQTLTRSTLTEDFDSKKLTKSVLPRNQKEVIQEANIIQEIRDIFTRMDSKLEQEIRSFQVDPVIKNVHLTLEDTEILHLMFRRSQDMDWVREPQMVDFMVTFLRQYKSAVNIIKKLRQLENIECQFILNLSEEVFGEYSKNLRGRLKRRFKDWFDDTRLGFCE